MSAIYEVLRFRLIAGEKASVVTKFSYIICYLT